MLWPLVNVIFAIMFSSKVLGINFIYWEFLKLEMYSVDNIAGLKLVASESAQILLPASR